MHRGEVFHTHHMIYTDGHIVFWANALQKMVDIDIQSGMLKLLFTPDNTDVSRVFEYYEGRYYLFELYKKAVSIIDKEEGTTVREYISRGMISGEAAWELSAFRYEDDVYVYGESQTIIRYNLKTKEWKAFGCSENVKQDKKCKAFLSNQAFYHKGRTFFLFAGEAARLMVLNCVDDSVEFASLDLPSGIKEVGRMASYEDEVFLYVKNCRNEGEIYAFAIDGQSAPERLGELGDYNNSCLLIPTRARVLVLPCRCDRAYSIELKTHRVSRETGVPVMDSRDFGNDFTSNYNYICGLTVDEKYYTVHPWSQSLVCVDRTSGDVQIIPIRISSEEYRNLNGGCVFDENKFFELQAFLDFVTEKDRGAE